MIIQLSPKKKKNPRLGVAASIAFGSIVIYILCPVIFWLGFLTTIVRYPNSHITFDEHDIISPPYFYTVEGYSIPVISGYSKYVFSSAADSDQINRWYRQLNWIDRCLKCPGNAEVTKLDFGFLDITLQKAASAEKYTNKKETQIIMWANYDVLVKNGWLTALLFSLPEFVLCFIVFYKNSKTLPLQGKKEKV